MRVLVFGDIHGNYQALRAVLDAADTAGFDQAVCLGDVALLGPQPAACIDALRDEPSIVVLRGNTDRELAEDADKPGVRWCRRVIGTQRLRWLAALPTIHTLTVINATFVHASPRGDAKRLAPDTGDDKLRRALHGIGTRTLVHGHTHQQYLTVRDGRTITNPGSVGFPFDGDQRAAWALIDADAVSLRRTSYPVDETIRLLAATRSPVVDVATHRLATAGD
jgi:putative phosphoesterase